LLPLSTTLARSPTGELAGCWIVASRVSSGRARTFSE
jgi:hypothetical protein